MDDPGGWLLAGVFILAIVALALAVARYKATADDDDHIDYWGGDPW